MRAWQPPPAWHLPDPWSWWRGPPRPPGVRLLFEQAANGEVAALELLWDGAGAAEAVRYVRTDSWKAACETSVWYVVAS